MALYAVVILIGGYVGYRFIETKKAMSGIYEAELGQFFGPEDSKKVIVEFLDYRCSYCREADPIVKDLLTKRPDVKVIIRHYPVFARPSIIEAEVALAAGMQGKFREAHDALVQREEPITDREIEDLAQSLGLDMDKFRVDMKGPEIGYLLLNTLDTVKILGINSTPSFVVGDIIYSLESGLPDVATFERLLKEAYGE